MYWELKRESKERRHYNIRKNDYTLHFWKLNMEKNYLWGKVDCINIPSGLFTHSFPFTCSGFIMSVYHFVLPSWGKKAGPLLDKFSSAQANLHFVLHAGMLSAKRELMWLLYSGQNFLCFQNSSLKLWKRLTWKKRIVLWE